MKKISFLNLGRHPITNNFLKTNKPKNEFFYNLKLIYNKETKLVSLDNFVPPKKMFNNKYAYFASQSQHMKIHFGKLAKDRRKEIQEKKNSL